MTMKPLSKEDLSMIVELLTTHSLDAESANIVNSALRTSYRNFSTTKKDEFFVGDQVVIDGDDGEKHTGKVHKVGYKNVQVKLDDDTIVSVNPTTRNIRKKT